MPFANPEVSKKYHKEYSKRWAKENPDKIKSIQAKYRATEAYRISVRKTNDSIPLSEHLKKVTKPFEKWEAPSTTDIKVKARRCTIRAVRRKKIIKPTQCESCKKYLEAKFIEAHHTNYKKWWKIKWLCRSCHRKQ